MQGVTTIDGTADNLGVLQDRAKLAGPFVLVASSIGGLTAEMFTRKYPERVASLSLHSAWAKTDAFVAAVVKGWQVMARSVGT